MLDNKIADLEEQLKTIKTLAISMDNKQMHKHINQFGKGIRWAKRMEAAAQKIEVAKIR